MSGNKEQRIKAFNVHLLPYHEAFQKRAISIHDFEDLSLRPLLKTERPNSFRFYLLITNKLFCSWV